MEDVVLLLAVFRTLIADWNISRPKSYPKKTVSVSVLKDYTQGIFGHSFGVKKVQDAAVIEYETVIHI